MTTEKGKLLIYKSKVEMAAAILEEAVEYATNSKIRTMFTIDAVTFTIEGVAAMLRKLANECIYSESWWFKNAPASEYERFFERDNLT